MKIQDCKVGDILVTRGGIYWTGFYKVLKVNKVTVKLGYLDKVKKDTSTKYIMKFEIKPGEKILETETKRNLELFSPYDPTRTYYEVIY